MEYKDFEKEQQQRKEAVTKERAEAFLADLKEVYAKHGLVLNGCGCCGSPFIDLIDEKKEMYLEPFYGGYGQEYRQRTETFDD